MVAVELWITAVTRVPVSTPVIKLPETFSSTFFKAAPELFFKPSPMTSMPYKNMARPPSICMMADRISIAYLRSIGLQLLYKF